MLLSDISQDSIFFKGLRLSSLDPLYFAPSLLKEKPPIRSLPHIRNCGKYFFSLTIEIFYRFISIMTDNDKKVKTSIFFSNEENKKIKIYCVENNISLQEFIHYAAIYCLEKKVKPKGN